MIDVVGLHKSFNGQEVLKGVGFRVEKGEVFTVIGGSGQGKSVLLKHLLGLIKPDKGHVYVDGTDIAAVTGEELYKARDRFGYLFQGGALFDSMTIFDNVAFPLQEKTKMKAAEIKDRAEAELAKVGLSGMGHKFPAEVSGGMKKRAAFARVLVMNPEIVLFDEPTTGLDPVLVDSVHRLIVWGRENYGYTAVVVSHEIPEIFDISDRVGMLDGGVMLQVGTPGEIKGSDNPRVRRFVRGESEGAAQF
ncbi:MAG: ATP-binding cassette domain-containing protein [Nitrospirae bacterium]|nr:ATP-binding cassette domain-containing protein [Nitrospirota bacterium]MBI5695905.1 ATP-binding cassette domain-containing protein [Nitrospirota bacterium]